MFPCTRTPGRKIQPVRVTALSGFCLHMAGDFRLLTEDFLRKPNPLAPASLSSNMVNVYVGSTRRKDMLTYQLTGIPVYSLYD